MQSDNERKSLEMKQISAEIDGRVITVFPAKLKFYNREGSYGYIVLDDGREIHFGAEALKQAEMGLTYPKLDKAYDTQKYQPVAGAELLIGTLIKGKPSVVCLTAAYCDAVFHMSRRPVFRAIRTKELRDGKFTANYAKQQVIAEGSAFAIEAQHRRGGSQDQLAPTYTTTAGSTIFSATTVWQKRVGPEGEWVNCADPRRFTGAEALSIRVQKVVNRKEDQVFYGSVGLLRELPKKFLGDAFVFEMKRGTEWIEVRDPRIKIQSLVEPVRKKAEQPYREPATPKAPKKEKAKPLKDFAQL